MSQFYVVAPVGWRSRDAFRISFDQGMPLSALKAAIRKAIGPEANSQVNLAVSIIAYN